MHYVIKIWQMVWYVPYLISFPNIQHCYVLIFFWVYFLVLKNHCYWSLQTMARKCVIISLINNNLKNGYWRNMNKCYFRLEWFLISVICVNVWLYYFIKEWNRLVFIIRRVISLFDATEKSKKTFCGIFPFGSKSCGQIFVKV